MSQGPSSTIAAVNASGWLRPPRCRRRPARVRRPVVRLVAAEEGEGYAFLCQAPRDGQADAFGAAGDQRASWLCHMMMAMSLSRFSVRSSCVLPARYCLGHACSCVAEGRRGVQGEMRIGEVRAGQGAKIGAAGGDDRVQMIGFGDVARPPLWRCRLRCGYGRRRVFETCGRRWVWPRWRSGRRRRRSGLRRRL